MSNKVKKEKKNKSRKIARAIISVLNGSFLTRDNVVKNMPFILFIVGLMVLYIAYGYSAERIVRDLHQVDVELKEVRSDYISKRAELDQEEQQSEVAEDIERLGLKESEVPPIKIVVDQKDLEGEVK